MPDALQIESQLSVHTLPEIAAHLPKGEFVLPHYGGLGIANLPATLAALLGGELPEGCPPLQADLWTDWQDGLKRIVLVVIDALGYHQLRAAMDADDSLVMHLLAEQGRLVPLTSVFPSTTNTVLTTLWTGHSPASHGILAYELYLRELGVAASTLFFWPVEYRQRDSLADWGLDPETFVPVAGLAEQLLAQGITTRSFISKAYADSFLSLIHRRGVKKTVGYAGAGDMWYGMGCTIEEHRQEKLLLTAYWDTIDGITHLYGPDDGSWAVELGGISWMLKNAFLDRLSPAARKGTLLLLTADHGGLTTPPRAAIQLSRHPRLAQGLSLPPLGETRVPFLHTRGDTLAQAEGYMHETLGNSFVTLNRNQILSSGLLGPGQMYEETEHRLGDLVGLARGRFFLARNKHQARMPGRHGGLSPQEMLVPLLGVRLDAL